MTSSSLVPYTVTAADTTTATYTVTVSVPSYYVDPATGSDANPGTQASPFKTITWAINAASAVAAINGAGIHAASGVYSIAANNETFPLMPTTGEHLIGPVIGSGTANIDGAGSYTISGGDLSASIPAKWDPIFTTIAFAPGVTGSVEGITVNDGSYPSVLIPNVIVADKATVTLSGNTFTFDMTNNIYYPVWIVNDSVATLDSNTITAWAAVEVADSATQVFARNNRFEGSYGVVTGDTVNNIASQLDLGTAASPGKAASPGNNTILSDGNAGHYGVASYGQSGDPGVTAVGNTWIPGNQGADGNGNYNALQSEGGPTNTAGGTFNNYYVYPTAGIQF